MIATIINHHHYHHHHHQNKPSDSRCPILGMMEGTRTLSGDTGICKADSLCYTSETSALYSNYTPIKKIMTTRKKIRTLQI